MYVIVSIISMFFEGGIMAVIKKICDKDINGLHVNLYEFDVNDKTSVDELRNYLIEKVKNSKAHSKDTYDLSFYSSSNMDPRFIKRFNAQAAAISVPVRTSNPTFDVRRERITEWMAQFLLEQKLGCKFYDEADKRMNLNPVEINKHTPGIDVPGIWIDGNTFRFIVCEVKAAETKIPCSSAVGLMNDIQKSIDNKNGRLSLEILDYMSRLKNITIRDDLLEHIVVFLSNVIADSKNLTKDTMLLPFLIINYKDIVKNHDLRDFDKFFLNNVNKSNVENILFSFEKSFTDFSNDIYSEAIGG